MPKHLPRLFAALALFADLPASAQPQPATIAPADLAQVMSVYVDSIVELRQFYIACAEDPQNWDREADVLIASLKAAGLDATAAAKLRDRLATGKNGSTVYDCAGEVARQRLSNPPAVDWSVYHQLMLTSIRIAVVDLDAQEDPRLAALRTVFSDYIPQQAAALNCLSLIEPQNFPQSYADWNGLVDDAQTAIRAAGFAAETVETLAGPARSARLMRPISDRQAEIAACMNDNSWMTWTYTMRWYGLVSDVNKALGIAQ